jgi:hypothetical protein
MAKLHKLDLKPVTEHPSPPAPTDGTPANVTA